MSAFQASATLTGALLANKGAAAPSGALSALLNEPLSDAAPRPGPVVRPVADSPPKPVARPRIKLSLRLDRDRHLRLKLAAAHLRRSSQEILLTALDEFLSRAAPDIVAGDCACLVAAEKPNSGDAD